jgi:hypothetical protein
MLTKQLEKITCKGIHPARLIHLEFRYNEIKLFTNTIKIILN